MAKSGTREAMQKLFQACCLSRWCLSAIQQWLSSITNLTVFTPPTCSWGRASFLLETEPWLEENSWVLQWIPRKQHSSLFYHWPLLNYWTALVFLNICCAVSVLNTSPVNKWFDNAENPALDVFMERCKHLNCRHRTMWHTLGLTLLLRISSKSCDGFTLYWHCVG